MRLANCASRTAMNMPKWRSIHRKYSVDDFIVDAEYNYIEPHEFNGGGD